MTIRLTYGLCRVNCLVQFEIIDISGCMRTTTKFLIVFINNIEKLFD